MEDFILEKSVWDHHDFENMGWHDATLWSVVANTESYEFLVDLDYIFKWVSPGVDETHYRFWVAPVTMVFENAFDIALDIQSSQGSIEVENFHRVELGLSPNKKFIQYGFRYECQEGVISLNATGYKMFVRQKPVLIDHQSLAYASRGGVSFSRTVTS